MLIHYVDLLRTKWGKTELFDKVKHPNIIHRHISESVPDRNPDV